MRPLSAAGPGPDEEEPGETIPGKEGIRPVEGVVVAILALLAILAASGISLFALDGMPHVADEQAYFFQARVLSRGRIHLSPPAEPGLFDVQHVLIDDEGWRAMYPPGWPVLLATGILVGAPWLVNPLLLGLSVAMVWWLGRNLFDPEIGVVAALLLAGSPFALSMGAGTMSHPGTLLLALLTLACLARADRSPGRVLPWVLAGLAAGVCLSIRPFTAVLLLGPPVLAFALRSPRRVRGLSLLASGALPGALFLIGYNT
ncbi:MAG: glycosyltransferase family 39 protein, partial [Thermoanaerobaculia bacterium]|nr:glycosyltransferase family 39 protein [Thermoanaerobaculia bacterium]